MDDLTFVRAMEMGKYILNAGMSLKYAAKIVGVTEEEAYELIYESLPRINPALSREVHAILCGSKIE